MLRRASIISSWSVRIVVACNQQRHWEQVRLCGTNISGWDKVRSGTACQVAAHPSVTNHTAHLCAWKRCNAGMR